MDSIRFVAAARGEEETRSSRSSYAKPHSDRLVVTTRDFTMCVQRESFFFLFFSNNFRLMPFFSYLIWVGIRPHLPNEKFSYFLKRNAAVELRHWRIFFVSLSLFLFVPVEKRKFWTMAQGGCKVRGVSPGRGERFTRVPTKMSLLYHSFHMQIHCATTTSSRTSGD